MYKFIFPAALLLGFLSLNLSTMAQSKSKTKPNDIVATETTTLTLHGVNINIGGISRQVPKGLTYKTKMVRLIINGVGTFDLAEGNRVSFKGRTYTLTKIRKSWFRKLGKITLTEN